MQMKDSETDRNSRKTGGTENFIQKIWREMANCKTVFWKLFESGVLPLLYMWNQTKWQANLRLTCWALVEIITKNHDRRGYLIDEVDVKIACEKLGKAGRSGA